MAGSDPTGAFIADEYRTNMRRVLAMALAQDQMLRPIFLFPRERTYSEPDAGGQPFDWTKPALTDSSVPDGEKVVYSGEADDEVAVGIADAGGRGGTQTNETAFADFDAERRVLSMLDVDYAKIVVAGDRLNTFDRVRIGGSLYSWQFEEEPTGLFEVTWHKIVVQAIDLGKPAVVLAGGYAGGYEGGY